MPPGGQLLSLQQTYLMHIMVKWPSLTVISMSVGLISILFRNQDCAMILEIIGTIVLFTRVLYGFVLYTVLLVLSPYNILTYNI